MSHNIGATIADFEALTNPTEVDLHRRISRNGGGIRLRPPPYPKKTCMSSHDISLSVK